MISWLLRRNCGRCDNTIIAATFGHITCLKNLHKNGHPWDHRTCIAAARNNNLDCLTYAHENGCPWNSKTIEVVTIFGYFECLKYCHENGCALSQIACDIAAKNGHWECLHYLIKNGCSWNFRNYLICDIELKFQYITIMALEFLRNEMKHINNIIYIVYYKNNININDCIIRILQKYMINEFNILFKSTHHKIIYKQLLRTINNKII